jgi:hypothetical protein
VFKGPGEKSQRTAYAALPTRSSRVRNLSEPPTRLSQLTTIRYTLSRFCQTDFPPCSMQSQCAWPTGGMLC